MELVTTAMFKIAWIAICPITPTTSMAPNRSGALLAMTIIRHKSIMNMRIMATAPNNPSSSQIMEKIMSFCASGRKLNFCILCPSPLPQMPPLPMAYSACRVWKPLSCA